MRTGKIISAFPNPAVRLLQLAAICCSLWQIQACGPKEIGEGQSQDLHPGSDRPSAAEQMRYPVLGSGNTQHMLYHYNRPEIMEKMQNWNIQQFNRLHGHDPKPEQPEYRAVPKQASPFRQ